MVTGSPIPFVPTPRDLDALLAARSGELRDTPYRLLLMALALREKSAVLYLQRGPLEKEVFFHSGAASDCQSNIATETLGRFLVSSGRIEERDYSIALSAAASLGVHVEDVLLERNIITAIDLDRARQQSLGRKLLEPFSWTSGSWRISYDVAPPATALRVRVPQLLVTGIAKVEPLETVEAAIDAIDDWRITTGASPLFAASDLRLTPEQQELLQKLENRLTVAEVRQNVAVREDADRFLFALLLLGIAAPAEERKPAPAAASEPTFELDLPEEKPLPHVPAAAAPPAPMPVASPRASAEEVNAAWAARQRDAFGFLGVDVEANPLEIGRTYIRFAERFLPSRFEGSEELREKAQEVFLAAARAYAELADPMRRQSLIERRSGPRPVLKPEPAPEAIAPPPAPPPPAPRAAQPTPFRRAVIDPEELHREGRAAAAAGKLREALGYFEMAAECDAQNGTYAAEVAYCRFQLLISPAATTLKSLKNAIRIDPRCGIAYQYAGKVQEALGNHVEAQAYFGRASSLLPRARNF